MLNWNCIAATNLPWILTDEQKPAFREAWETFKQQTSLSRLKKAAIVLVVCLLGVWVTLPSVPKDTLASQLAAELNQARTELDEEEQRIEKKEQERDAPFRAEGIPSPYLVIHINPAFKEKIRQLETALEIARKPKEPRVTSFQKTLTLILAIGFWLYLMAHTFDGGYQEERGFTFRYLCTRQTLKDNLLELGTRFGELLGKGGQMLRADMATQSGCLIGGAVVLGILFLIWFAFLFVFSALHFFALVMLCGSAWLLLGWYIWDRPIQIKWRTYSAISSHAVEHIRGRKLVEMPTASCTGPSPSKPLVPGDYLKGSLTLLEDGSYLIGSMMVDQASAFSGANINGVKISKEFGEGHEIKFEAGDETLRVRFTDGQWREIGE